MRRSLPFLSWFGELAPFVRLVTGVAAAVASLALLGSCAGPRPTLGVIKPRTTTIAATTTAIPASTIVPATTRPGSSTSGTGASTATDGATTTVPAGSNAATTPSTGVPSSRAPSTTVAGSVGGRGAPTTTASTTTTAATTNTATAPLRRSLGPDDLIGFIATPIGAPVVLATPDPSAPALPIPAKTSAGAPTTFAVIGDASPGAPQAHEGWLQVELPTRPNGAIGWVRTASVQLTKTPMRVFVDLSTRRIRVENAGRSVLDTPVAIGTSANPTPTGASYVTELIENVRPNGTYGPYAFGLALHSDTLTEFAGGPGQVGIHGTNQPNLIGEAVSHGCIRLNNDAVRRMVALQLPLGVPVFIT
ncbi:MAG: L,D-transpeptidase family protein [Acidimicrobiales bacterium]